MTRSVLVVTWCDLCPGEVPGTGHLIAVDGPTREIDLCDDHWQTAGGAALQATLAASGRSPGVGTPNRNRGGRRPSQAPEVGGFSCLADGCGRTFGSQQGLSMHMVRTHGAAPKARTSRAVA